MYDNSGEEMPVSLSERVAMLGGLMISAATGGSHDDPFYPPLRTEFMNDPDIRDRLPEPPRIPGDRPAPAGQTAPCRGCSAMRGFATLLLERVRPARACAHACDGARGRGDVLAAPAARDRTRAGCGWRLWSPRGGETLKGHGMSISPETVRFDDDTMWVGLSDGRVIGVPLAWFPRLLHADPATRTAFTLSAFGIHWETLDEDISVAGLLAGRGDMSGVGEVA